MPVSCGSSLATALSAAALLWLCGTAAAAAVSVPNSCDDIETAAAGEPRGRYYANKRHRELMAAFEQEGQLGAKEMKALRRIRDDGAKRDGRKTAAYAILTLDLDRIGAANGEENKAETDAAFDLLRSTAKSKEEIETLLQRAAENTEEDSLQAALQAVEKHRASFGAAFRQVEAISRSEFEDVPADVLAAAGTRIEETGRQLQSERAIYRGKYMRLAGLNRSASPDAAALAAELLPKAAARIEKSVASVMTATEPVERLQQCWTEQPAIREIATALPPSPELARLSMLNTMLFHQDGLHGVEFWYPFIELVAEKDQNADAFREAMRLGSRAGGAQEIDEASFAITAARAMAETSYPALARTFFEAALAWSDEAETDDPETRLVALHGYAEFEWSAGNSGRVEPLVDEIDRLVKERSGGGRRI